MPSHYRTTPESKRKVRAFFVNQVLQTQSTTISNLRVRDIAEAAGVAPGTLNKVIKEFCETGELSIKDQGTNSRKIRNEYIYNGEIPELPQPLKLGGLLQKVTNLPADFEISVMVNGKKYRISGINVGEKEVALLALNI